MQVTLDREINFVIILLTAIFNVMKGISSCIIALSESIMVEGR